MSKEKEAENPSQEQTETETEEVLTPIEEKRVSFYGDEITAALVHLPGGENQIYVALRPICDYLGLDSQAQVRRIRRDVVLAEYLKGVAIMATPSASKRSSGGVQTTFSLPLEMLPGWLFGIDANRVRPELREKVIRYQKECFRVLWQAFEGEAVSLAAATSAQSEADVQAGRGKLVDLTTLTDEEAYKAAEEAIAQEIRNAPPDAGQLALLQIREMGLSIANMAEQQLKIEQETNRAHHRLDMARAFVLTLQKRIGDTEHRLGEAEGRLDTTEQKLDQTTERLSVVEDRVNPPADYITDEQAARLATEIKALAELLTSNEAAELSQAQGQTANQGSSKNRKPQNYYAAIFAELYRRFSVSTYRNVRLGEYATVLQFLADWKHAADNGVSNEVFLQGHLF